MRWIPLPVPVVLAAGMFLGFPGQIGAHDVDGRDPDVARLVETPSGIWPLTMDPRTGRPALLADPRLTWHIDARVSAAYGFEAVARGLSAFNDVPGSLVDFSVTRSGGAGAGPSRDGINLVFVDDTCRRSRRVVYGAVHPYAAGRFPADPATGEVDIGLCPDLRGSDPRFVTAVVRHEVGHALGLGHLHAPGEAGWTPDTGEDNVCRFMFHSVHRCQPFGPAERELAAQLYPAADTDPTARRRWEAATRDSLLSTTITTEPRCPVVRHLPRGIQRADDRSSCAGPS